MPASSEIGTVSGDAGIARRVIVADDHPIFREGLRRILVEVEAPDEVGEAATYEEVLNLARAGQAPFMFVLDLCFPGMDLTSAVPALRREFPRASIIIVSMADDRASTDRVMSAGVDGFISKSVDTDAMRSAFVAIQQGEFVNVRVDRGLSGAKGIAPQFPGLTPRQIEVLRFLADGRSNKEIARLLSISPFTVRLHVSAAMRELGVDSRSAAAAMVVKFGL